MISTELHLDIDSHVVIQLGAELISDAEQALLELVKNAYDGDATRCTISIDPNWIPEASDPWHAHLIERSRQQNERVGRIVVEDNGVGVSEQAVGKGWLMISASLKRPTDGAKLKTGRQRVPVGDKGLGRLATMRLGDVLLLRTKTKKEKSARTVAFAWSGFKSGAPLKDVKVISETGASLRGRDQGTNVEILGLNEPQYWDSENNVRGVIAKLSSLISPFKRFQDFQVNVRYNEQLRDLQSLSAEALNHASARFAFSYSEGVLSFKAWFSKTLFRGQSGQASRDQYQALLGDKQLPKAIDFFASRPRIKSQNFKSLLDEVGGWLCSIEGSIAWADLPRDPKLVGAVDPGPFAGEIHYVLFNEPTKQSLQAAGIPVEVLQEMTSIGVFRDGFRVRMDDDWLEISKGVTSGGFFQLRPKNVVGFFEVSNEHNAGLVEKSDREGFVDNPASRGFMLLALRAKKWANDSLDSLRTAYDDYKKADGIVTASDVSTSEAASTVLQQRKSAATDSLKLATQRSGAIAKSLAAVRHSVAIQSSSPSAAMLKSVSNDLGEISKSITDFQQILEAAGVSAAEGFGAAEHVIASNEQLTEHNLRLIDAAAVGLSARGLTHEINAYVTRIDEGLANIRKVNRAKPDKRLDDAIDKIAGAIRELRKTVSSINPLLAGSRSLKDNFSLGGAIRDFVALRSNRAAELNVNMTVVGGQGPQIRFARTRFNQVLENLFQNSVYWIEEHAVQDAKVERTIEVEIDKYGLTWCDGAKGIREAIADSVFEPYVTDKPPIRGQGLGLFLVTAFLEAEKCHISLLPDRNRFGLRHKFRVDVRGAIVP